MLNWQRIVPNRVSSAIIHQETSMPVTSLERNPNMKLATNGAAGSKKLFISEHNSASHIPGNCLYERRRDAIVSSDL